MSLIKLRWETPVLIRNIPYLIRSYVEPMPYTGYIECKLQKMALVSNAVVPPDDESTDVHFTDVRLLSADDFNYVAIQYLKGEAGATITITVVNITQTDAGFYFKVNNLAKLATETYTVVLDANGDGSYTFKLGGVTVHGKVILVNVQITATTIGIIGTPDTAQYSKST
jgi:hypothetical protein